MTGNFSSWGMIIPNISSSASEPKYSEETFVLLYDPDFIIITRLLCKMETNFYIGRASFKLNYYDIIINGIRTFREMMITTIPCFN